MVPSLELLALLSLLPYSESIIRNDITDRCLHLRSYQKAKDSRKLPVYGRGCSWDVPEHNQASHKNEHIEVVPYSISQQGHSIFLIRRVPKDSTYSTNSTTCLTSLNNQPSVSSSCDQSNSQALFEIGIVPQTNFRGYLTSSTSFKIRNENGNCLTVKPGSDILRFMECSPRYGLFQVWSLCRHNRQCDVDLTWTPRKIDFPKNETNTTTGTSQKENIKIKLAPSESVNVECSTTAHLSSGGDGVTNEVLYTIENALKIYSGSEVFLASSLDAFYPKEVLSDAVKLTQNLCLNSKMECDLCANRKSDMPDVIFLIKWVTDCNVGPSKRKLLSEDVLQVLLHLFPFQDSLLRTLPTGNTDEKIKMVILSLKKYLGELEDKVKGNVKVSTIPPVNRKGEVEKGTGNWGHPSIKVEEDEDGSYVHPTILDIDIRRLGSSLKTVAKNSSQTFFN